MDKLVLIHEVLKPLQQPTVKPTVSTDNLSLRLCLFSERPTKEERLPKEFAAIRDLIEIEQKKLKLIPGDMLYCCLTKARIKENSLIKAIKSNSFPNTLFFDDEEATPEEMSRVEELIEMQSFPEDSIVLRLYAASCVDKVLHGKSSEFEQLWLMHHNEYQSWTLSELE